MKERELKLKEKAVTFLGPNPCALEGVLIVASATLGLKSIVFLRSNKPDGSRTSGSTLVAVYVGISL